MEGVQLLINVLAMLDGLQLLVMLVSNAIYTKALTNILACSHQTIFLALCSPKCVNGRCTHPNQCSCASGWTGATCNSGMPVTPVQVLHNTRKNTFWSVDISISQQYAEIVLMGDAQLQMHVPAMMDGQAQHVILVDCNKTCG